MKEIKWLAHRIEEELEDAETYAKEAAKHKDTNRGLSQTLAQICKEELGHSEMLHIQAERLIAAQREAGITAPSAMQAVWDWEHEKMIEHTARIKHLLDMLK